MINVNILYEKLFAKLPLNSFIPHFAGHQIHLGNDVNTCIVIIQSFFLFFTKISQRFQFCLNCAVNMEYRLLLFSKKNESYNFLK